MCNHISHTHRHTLPDALRHLGPSRLRPHHPANRRAASFEYGTITCRCAGCAKRCQRVHDERNVLGCVGGVWVGVVGACREVIHVLSKVEGWFGGEGHAFNDWDLCNAVQYCAVQCSISKASSAQPVVAVMCSNISQAFGKARVASIMGNRISHTHRHTLPDALRHLGPSRLRLHPPANHRDDFYEHVANTCRGAGCGKGRQGIHDERNVWGSWAVPW